MASETTLKQRTQDHPSTTAPGGGATKRRDDKMGKAARGLKSLGVALAIPLALTVCEIFLFGPGKAYSRNKPFWFPPVWGLHLGRIVYSLVLGLSSWLVWAEGGFHKPHNVLPIYMGQVMVSLLWEPVALRIGATWIGLLVCFAQLGVLFVCYKRFRPVNPIASDLVRPCMAWVAYLTLVNFSLVFV